jgi:hypothetical protein
MSSKHRIIDGGTAFHFGIGTVAGYSGMDPKVVLLVALVASAAWEVIQAGRPSVVFDPEHPQSKAKEIVNLLAIIAGASAGKAAKEHAFVPPAPTAATAPAAMTGVYW